MKIVRQKCFETNSSSCHSLTMANPGYDKLSLKPELIKALNEYKDKPISVELTGYSGGDFWVETLEEKLSYIFSDLCTGSICHSLVHQEMNIPEPPVYGDMQSWVDSLVGVNM